jgi:hypothetical protein
MLLIFLKEELESMVSYLGCCHHLQVKNSIKQTTVCKTAIIVQSVKKGTCLAQDVFIWKIQRTVPGYVGQFVDLCHKLLLTAALATIMPAITSTYRERERKRERERQTKRERERDRQTETDIYHIHGGGQVERSNFTPQGEAF